MPRRPRVKYPDALFHVIGRGNNGRPIVRTVQDRRLWYDTLSQYAELYQIKIIAHVLMTNHFHLLIQDPLESLSEFMRDFLSAYVQRFKTRHRHRGYLFQDRFKSFIIQRDSYFLQVLRYIHLNPYAANMVGKPEDYRWSSFGEYLGIFPPLIPLSDSLVRSFFPRRMKARFLAFHLDKSIESPELKWTQGVGFYGDNKFQASIESQIDQSTQEGGRQSRRVLTRIALPQFERELASIFSSRVPKLMKSRQHDDGPLKGRIILLCRELCGATYQEMARRWKVSASTLSQRFSRYSKSAPSSDREEIERLRTRILASCGS